MDLLLLSTIVAVAIFVVLAAFQAGLAAGQPWGEAAYGGLHRRISSQLRRTSAVAVPVWLLAAVFVVRCSQDEGLLGLSAGSMRIVCWVIAGYLALGVVMNVISRSKIERNIWTPVSAVALISTVMVLFLSNS